ncbi:hypothetical protein [Antribacter gilvus]|uniref:hypothetical protein n=1 Tax=Antribacter gilvus TaxID=2304675 RepID=UPI000F7B56AE|nr:hypothetical protein [Antribacter gilvus]
MNRRAPGAGGQVSIDRLTVRGVDLSEADARRLGVLVAQALGRLPAAGLRSSASASVDVDQEPGQGVEQLARAVVARLEAALREEGPR